MKLYLFTQSTNYGEFIEIVCAKSAEEAWDISDAKRLGWENHIEELKITTESKIIFKGGGE